MYHVHLKQHILYASSITFANNLVCNTLLKLVSGRPTDQPTDIATYRAAIAAKNKKVEKVEKLKIVTL